MGPPPTRQEQRGRLGREEVHTSRSPAPLVPPGTPQVSLTPADSRARVRAGTCRDVYTDPLEEKRRQRAAEEAATAGVRGATADPSAPVPVPAA